MFEKLMQRHVLFTKNYTVSSCHKLFYETDSLEMMLFRYSRLKLDFKNVIEQTKGPLSPVIIQGVLFVRFQMAVAQK